MKSYYQNGSSCATMVVAELIKIEISKLEKLKKFGRNPDGFLEKYEDPFMDSYREVEKDFEVSNSELLKSFEIAFAYLERVYTN
ncbi:hypothetical protein [Filifactor villosus]|uniref:HEPN domain-containing protein n=1 Tax=Filifactor villosus TaxID=29374 RepID=A0ABV9QP48_9FIRM